MWSDLIHCLRAIFRRRTLERELDQELQFHLERQTEKYVKSGLSAEEASRRARLELGGVDQTKEQYRDALGTRFIETLLSDIRHTFRQFGRAPGFVVVAVMTLALGIGATTAIFSVVNGVFLRPLPYPNAERLMQPLTIFASGSQGSFSYPDFEDLRDQNRTFLGLAAYTIRGASAAMGGQGFRVGWTRVSPGFLSLIGKPPALGRGFTADEEQTGGPVAVVSYGYWQNRLAGRSDFASESVRVNDQTYTVIGVMPRGYDFPAGTELWAPLQPPGHTSRTAKGYQVVGRLRDDIFATAAQQDLSAVAARLKQQYGDDEDMVAASARSERISTRSRAYADI